jgi:hypothetical protein
MTSRIIFLSLISVGCTGLTLAAISLPLPIIISAFEKKVKRKKKKIKIMRVCEESMLQLKVKILLSKLKYFHVKGNAKDA